MASSFVSGIPIKNVDHSLSSLERLLWFSGTNVDEIVCQLSIVPHYKYEGDKCVKGSFTINKSNGFSNLFSIYHSERLVHFQLERYIDRHTFSCVELSLQDEKGYISLVNPLKITSKDKFKFTFLMDMSHLRFDMKSFHVHALFPVIMKVGYLRKAKLSAQDINEIVKSK